MSDDLVNQLTLNFLISKHQLQKLNKKVKETSDQTKTREIKEYNERIKILFDSLLVNNPPDDLLCDVKNSFDTFIDKSIYYFKAHDNTIALENERNNDVIHDDIDYEKEEREIEKGNYTETTANYYEDEDDDEEYDEEDDEDAEEEDDDDSNSSEEANDGSYESEVNQTNNKISKIVNHNPIIVERKYHKKNNSNGVDDIQKLPLNWFENVRQTYKSNQIIPRKKEPIANAISFTDSKKKI